MPADAHLRAAESPGSDLRYFVTTAGSLKGLDLSGYPDGSLWALMEFEELVRLVQMPQARSALMQLSKEP
jgi:hypothetical protein